MNGFAQLRPVSRLALPLLFALALLRPAQAAESITMVWIDAASGQRYEVVALDDLPLLQVKQEVMRTIGLSPLQSPLYAVEKVVVTSTPVRGQYDPVTGLPVVITTEEVTLLNEASTLAELGLATGDTLRLRQLEVTGGDTGTGDTGGDTTGDTTTDPTDGATDDGAESDDDAQPSKSGHHRGFKRHSHRHGGKHSHKSSRHRFG